MAGYRTLWEGDLGYMQNYLDDFHTTKDVFLRFRGGKRGKAMAEKAKARVMDGLNKAYDAEKLARARASQIDYTSAQDRTRKAEIEAEGQAAYDTTYKSSLNFAFVKLHLMSHFAESISAFGSNHSVNTEFGERAQQQEQKGPWKFSNKNSGAQNFMLLDRERYWGHAIRRLELEACMREYPAFRSSEVQAALDLFPPEKRIAANAFRRRHLPIPAGYDYRDTRTPAEVEGVSYVLKWPHGDNYYVDMEKMDGYRVGLKSYLRRYLRDNSDDGSEVPPIGECGKYVAREFKVLEVTREEYFPYNGCEPDSQIIRCYGKRQFRKKFRNDDIFVEYMLEEGNDGDRLYQAPDGTTRTNRHMQGLEAAKLIRLLQIWKPVQDREPTPDEIYRLALVEFYDEMNLGNCEEHTGLCRVKERKRSGAQTDEWDLELVDIDRIFGAAHLIEIPRANHRGRERQFYVNNTADVRMFNTVFDRDFVVQARPDNMEAGVDYDEDDAVQEEDVPDVVRRASDGESSEEDEQEEDRPEVDVIDEEEG